MDNQEVQPVSPVDQDVNKSSNKIVLISFIVILVVVFGVAFIFLLSSTKKSSNISQNSTAKIPTTVVTPVPSVSAANSTDPQLDKDAQNIDNSIKNLDTDVNNVDQGLNDQPANLN